MGVKYLLILLLFILDFSAFAETSYMTLDDYFLRNPQEKIKMKQFSDIVSGSGVEIKSGKKISVAVVYPAMQKSDYWRFSVSSMEERLKELKVNYEIMRYFSKPSGDFRLQVTQIAEALKNGADYIAMSVDNENIKRYAGSVLAGGRAKVFIQNLTTPVKKWKSSKPYMYVGFDHIEGAKLISDYYAKHFNSGVKYLMLYGSKGSVSRLRGDGFEEYSFGRGFLPVAKFYTDFSAEKAYQATKAALDKHKDISFIYACSTDIAVGASRALKERGLLGKVMLNGWGGTELELELILKKELDFTVMRMNDDNGVAIAEAIKLDIEGESDKVPSVFSGEFVTVTSKMNKDQITTLKKRAFRYSGR